MSTPFISVIIPIYNQELYLRQCMDSVLSQTLGNIEVIAVNDGSTDSSLDIIGDYLKKDSRVKLINQENMGVAHARNNGLKVATGQFIAFIDPDDWYPEHDILEVMYETAIHNNVNIVGGSLSRWVSGQVVYDHGNINSGYNFEADRLMNYSDYQFDYGFWRFIYKSNMLRDNNIQFPLYQRFQDPPFFVNAMICAGEFYALTKTTYMYRVEAKQMNWTDRKVSDYIRGLTDILEISAKYSLEKLHSLIFYRLNTDYLCNAVAQILQQDSNNLPNLLVKANGAVDTALLTKKPIVYNDNMVIKPLLLLGSHLPWHHDELLRSQTTNIPKVSVVIPAYNMEKYIVESLKSITTQTLSDIQIICINDGSEDKTLEILNDFAQEDERIIVFSQHNQGLSAARNAGLAIASGEYVYFFDSDDILVENALEILYNHAKRTNSQNVLFDGIAFFENEDLKKSFPQFNTTYTYQRNHDYPGVYKGDELYAKMTQNKDYYPTAWLQFFEREYLQDGGYTFKVGILHEDNLFTHQTMLLCQRVSHLRINLFRRRIRENSIMTVAFSYNHFMGLYITIIEILRFLMSNQHKISEPAMLAVTQRLMSSHRNIYSKQKSIPREQWRQPQFSEPTLDLLSEIIYMPFRYRDEMEREHNATIAQLSQNEQAYQSERSKLTAQLGNKDATIQALQHEINCLKQSTAFKIGRTITFVPRKLRGLLRRIKHDGLLDTIRYAFCLIRGHI